jgi:acyl carrier protein
MQQSVPATGLQKDEIEAMVRDRIGRISIPKRAAAEIGLSDSLDEDLRVDSLGFIELLIELEKTFGFECAEDFLLLDAYPSVGAMVDYIAGRMQSTGDAGAIKRATNPSH